MKGPTTLIVPENKMVVNKIIDRVAFFLKNAYNFSCVRTFRTVAFIIFRRNRPMTLFRLQTFASVGTSLLCFVLVVCSAISLTAQEAAPDKTEKAVLKKAAKENPLKGKSRELDGAQFMTYDPTAPTPQMLQMQQMLPKADQNKPIAGPVLISATYYFGNADKDTVPVLLLHGMGGSRRDFTALTDTLANAGFAVLAPDLRGHGRSNKRYEIAMPNYAGQGATVAPGNMNMNMRTFNTPLGTLPSNRKLVDLKQDDILPKDYIDMAKYDLPLFRDTLIKLHERGNINLNRLVIIGIERGAALAAYQVMQDWAEKDSPRFTKTLIMIAPVDLDPNADTAKLFANNKWMGNGLGALFINPQQGTPMSIALCGKIRTELSGKDPDEATMAKFPMFSYAAEKKVKGEKGETVEPLTWAETFSNKETNVTKTIVDFINKRNASFKEKEARWSRIK